MTSTGDPFVANKLILYTHEIMFQSWLSVNPATTSDCPCF